MKTASFGFYATDVTAPALANRVAAGNSALVVGSFGAERYRSLMVVRGIQTFTLPDETEEAGIAQLVRALKAHRAGIVPDPCALFVPKVKHLSKTALKELFSAADVMAVLLPLLELTDIPGVLTREELREIWRHHIVMAYDPCAPETGWAAALSFEPEMTWTPDGVMWA